MRLLASVTNARSLKSGSDCNGPALRTLLSESCDEWPDIDLDLPNSDQRERVIQYVHEQYGERGAAVTTNVITYRSKLAARKMGSSR